MTKRLKPEEKRARALLRVEGKTKAIKVHKATAAEWEQMFTGGPAAKKKGFKADAFRINNKVAWPIAAAAAVNIIVEGVKAAGGVDFSSMQADMVLVSMAVVGYLVPSN